MDGSISRDEPSPRTTFRDRGQDPLAHRCNLRVRTRSSWDGLRRACLVQRRPGGGAAPQFNPVRRPITRRRFVADADVVVLSQRPDMLVPYRHRRQAVAMAGAAAAGLVVRKPVPDPPTRKTSAWSCAARQHVARRFASGLHRWTRLSVEPGAINVVVRSGWTRSSALWDERLRGPGRRTCDDARFEVLRRGPPGGSMAPAWHLWQHPVWVGVAS